MIPAEVKQNELRTADNSYFQRPYLAPLVKHPTQKAAEQALRHTEQQVAGTRTAPAGGSRQATGWRHCQNLVHCDKFRTWTKKASSWHVGFCFTDATFAFQQYFYFQIKCPLQTAAEKAGCRWAPQPGIAQEALEMQQQLTLSKGTAQLLQPSQLREHHGWALTSNLFQGLRLGDLLKTNTKQSRGLHWNRYSIMVTSEMQDTWRNYFLLYVTTIRHSAPSYMVSSLRSFEY